MTYVSLVCFDSYMLWKAVIMANVLGNSAYISNLKHFYSFKWINMKYFYLQFISKKNTILMSPTKLIYIIILHILHSYIENIHLNIADSFWLYFKVKKNDIFIFFIFFPIFALGIWNVLWFPYKFYNFLSEPVKISLLLWWRLNWNYRFFNNAVTNITNVWN